MPDFVPPDHKRCIYLWENGNRCRQYREPGADHGFCKTHYDKVERESRPAEPPWPEWLADAVLPEGTTLDSATAVNSALTRLIRVALQRRLPLRDAGSLGYLVQHVLTTLPAMKAEASAKPEHPLLGRDPDSAIVNLAVALQSALAPKPNPAPPGDTPPPNEAP
jgi:hypothetical protein